jgi:hypothetical protein
MSEENNQKSGQNIPAEVTIAVIGGAGVALVIEFADGARKIPDHVIRVLGGREDLEKLAPALKAKTYAEFLDGFTKMTNKRALNEFQRDFVGRHFGKRF